MLPVKSAYICSRTPERGFPGGGGLFAGMNDLGYAYRALLDFDLGALPEDARVHGARLSLCACAESSSEKPGLFAPFAILGAWGGNAVSWDDQPPHDPNLSGGALEVAGSGWYGWDVTGIAAQWTSGATANRGLLLRSSECTAGDIKKFHGESCGRRCAPSLDIRYCCGGGVCLGARGTLGTVEERRTGDALLYSRWQDTAAFSAFTYFALNTGPNPAAVFLQISPDAETPLDEPPVVTVEPGAVEAVVPRKYGFYARLAFRSLLAGRGTSLRIWFQAQV